MKPQDDLLNELKEISPLVAARERKNPFSVPENYFENFQSDIISLIKNEGGEGEVLPDIISQQKKNSFTVPENYFENLPNKILSAAKNSSNEKIVKLEVHEFMRSERRKILSVLSVAASVIFVFILLNHEPAQINKTIDARDFLASVSKDEINNYVNENFLDDEIQTIAETVRLPTDLFQKVKPITTIKSDSVVTVVPSEQDILMNINADDIDL